MCLNIDLAKPQYDIVSSPTDILFTGQRLDDGIGLYYYNARYYDPYIGRFISPDTFAPDPANPQSFNKYTYCLNNPLKYIDPSGHDPGEGLVPPSRDGQLGYTEADGWLVSVGGSWTSLIENSPENYNLSMTSISAETLMYYSGWVEDNGEWWETSINILSACVGAAAGVFGFLLYEESKYIDVNSIAFVFNDDSGNTLVVLSMFFSGKVDITSTLLEFTSVENGFSRDRITNTVGFLS